MLDLQCGFGLCHVLKQPANGIQAKAVLQLCMPTVTDRRQG